MEAGNQKLPIAEDADDRVPTRHARGQNAEFVHAQLRAEILTLGIEPGEELDEITLSKRFKVSRTPVREALIRLASEKLVVLSRNRRATVPALDLAGFPAYLEALELLQRAITRLAAQRRTRGDLAAIRTAGYGGEEAIRRNTLAAVENNLRFHQAIAAAAKSPHLAEAYHQVLVEGARYMVLSFSTHDQDDPGHGPHMRNVIQDHDAMVAAIGAGDADLAERLARDHVTLFRRRITAYLERNGTAEIAV